MASDWNKHQPKLTMNAVLVNVDSKQVEASILPFKSGEQLRELWDAHRETHFFRRVGEEILAVPVNASAQQLGNTNRSLDVAKEPALAADLVRRGLIEHLCSIQRVVLADTPIEFLGADNLLARWTAEILKFPDWVQIRELWEIAVRVVWLSPDSPVVMATFGLRLKKFISANCAELLGQGLGLDGIYVSTKQPHKNSRCDPLSKLTGRVASIGSDGVIQLDDHREDVAEVSASDAYPEASWEMFDRIIAHYGKGTSDSLSNLLEMKLSEHRHGPTKLNRIRETTAYFRRLKIQLLDNCRSSFGELVTQGKPGFPRIDKTHPPVYVFDPSGRKTDTWHDRGLDNYGPYHASHFPKSTPKVVVICQASKKGRVEQAIHKFLNGIHVPGLDEKGKRQPYAKGLTRKYLLSDVKLEFETADAPTFAAYEKAARRALEKSTPQSPISLALIQIEERFHNFSAETNPYFATKSIFLSNQVPVQEFEYETIDQQDQQLAYTFNNMALACYAKLGGVPWLLKADPVIAHELVVGLGSATISGSRLGSRERLVGITTLFSGDGQYYLSNISKSVPYKDYPQEMLSAVRASLDQARTTMNWQDGDHIRLIFHAFKPLKDEEARSLAAMMKSLGNYHADFALLHVVDKHPYQLFDEAQQGVWFGAGKPMKGVYAPERGRFIQLSRNETILTMTGPRDVKKATDGLPRPLLLRLHRESTFTDMPYLANQVARFGLHSWRSFFPSPLPVTIQYSDLIARLLGNLAKLPKWNPDVLLGQIRESRWFL